MDVSKDPRFWTRALIAIPVTLSVAHVAVLCLRAEPVKTLLDPYGEYRTDKYLGEWRSRQPRALLSYLFGSKEIPWAPDIKASMAHGFNGHNVVLISRCQVGAPAAASWATLFCHIHQSKANIRILDDHLVSSTQEWEHLPLKPLISRGQVVGAPISRTTLMALLVLSNARPTFQYSEASGFRANFASYVGQWYITWPIGKPATVNLLSHDLQGPKNDVYSFTFETRMDRCIQMMAGVVVGPEVASPERRINLGFPGRALPGRYRLEFVPRGFGGSHGSRHIYNMNGAQVYDVDFLFLRPREADELTARPDGGEEPLLELRLPSTEHDRWLDVLVLVEEQRMLSKALDCLPWSSLSWSLHRGLRDLLLAFAKPRMDDFRTALAQELCQLAHTFKTELTGAGWKEDFVATRMGEMAISAVLAGRGNSGDLVRIVTALAVCAVGEGRGGPLSYERLDETRFWRDHEHLPVAALDHDAIIALTKCFVLEWSQEFDYQLYHNLPVTLLLE